jgi:hypothetical protein
MIVIIILPIVIPIVTARVALMLTVRTEIGEDVG